MDGPRNAGGVVLFAESVDAASVDAMRGRIGEVGHRYGLAGLELTKLVLVIHELVVNAVRYGGGSAEVVVWTEPDGLRCSVSDQGHGIPGRYVDARTGVPGPGDLPEWGLRLVRLICSDVRMDSGGRGTVVEVAYRVGDRAELTAARLSTNSAPAGQ